MTKPRVFISYTGHDSEGNPDPETRALKDALAKALRDKGYRALVDTDGLKLGEDWRATLNVWTQSCDAAVVLLSKHALDSKYVAYEVSNFVHRKAADEDFGLFPVFVGAVDDLKVEASRLGPWRIQDVQSLVQGVPPSEIPAKIIEGLNEIEERKTPLDRFAQLLEFFLPELPSYKLEDEVERLGVDLADWVPEERIRRALALKMLGAGLTKASQTIRDARGFIKPATEEKQTVQDIIDLVGSAWVSLRSVTVIPDAAKEGASIAINGVDPKTAKLYVIRAEDAQRPPHDGWRVAEVTGTFGELEAEGDAVPAAVNHDEDDELVLEIRAALAATLGCDNEDEVASELATKKNKQEPVFVALPAAGLDKTKIDELKRDFDGVTFVFLTGPALPAESVLEAARVKLLVPALENGIELHFCSQYKTETDYLLEGN